MGQPLKLERGGESAMKELLKTVSREYWDALQLAKRIVDKDSLLGPDDARALATHLHIEAAKRTARIEREAKQEQKQAQAQATKQANNISPEIEAQAIQLAFGSATPKCPSCGSEMWNNMDNPKPNFNCKDENCTEQAKNGQWYTTKVWMEKHVKNALDGVPVEEAFSNEALQPADDLPF